MSQWKWGVPDPFLVLAFSGGGMRAAAFAHGALKELSKWERDGKRLLDNVAVISSVSGGSFTAAHFALRGSEGFKQFESQFLFRNVQYCDLLPYALDFRHIGKFLLRRWGPLLSDFLNERLLGRKRFRDLPSLPRLVVNATDLAQGRSFSFTERDFAFIGADLDSTRIADAVAASAALPGALTPITLRNRASGVRPEWVDTALKDLHVNLDRYRAAKAWVAYEKAKVYRYVHLGDGGLSDNSGAHAIAESFALPDMPPSLYSILTNSGSLRHLAVFGINAKTRPLLDTARRGWPPHAVRVLLKAMTCAMDLRTDDSIQQVETVLQNFAKAKDPYFVGDRLPKLSYVPIGWLNTRAYVGHVSFDSETSEESYNRLFSIGTDLKIGQETAEFVIEAGGRLLRENPAFARLVHDAGYIRDQR